MAQGGPRTRVEIRLSCRNLKDKDVLSKSDPMVVLYIQNRFKSSTWDENSRTERIKNSLNPDFMKVIELDYAFEEVQKLKFSVYDIDNESSTLEDDDFLGSVECTLGEIVSGSPYTKPLTRKGKESGTITINAEEQSSVQNTLELKFNGQGLDKKDLFGKSDPYLEFSKQNSDHTFTVVHRTEVMKNTLHPEWPMFTINSNTLCNSDESRNILVRCYDWDADGGHDLIGEFTTTLGEISGASRGKKELEWKLINPKKKEKKKNYTNSGTVHLKSVKILRHYSFLDYIIGGCQINFTVGIDFTASNGDPRHASSLHYNNPYSPNEYVRALRAVGEVCQDYDTDKLFPALGFGAQISGKVSHEFALNGNPTNPYCSGIQGVIDAYKQALQSVKLYGPTNMSPIIRHVSRFAEAAAARGDQQNYFILLILTDGEITDMPETKDAIIKASHLPMSIIIVGVGGCSFQMMVELDADEGRLRLDNEVAERDIVQFVPFRKHASSTPFELAKIVLAEVPQQLTDYMKLKGILPRKFPQQ